MAQPLTPEQLARSILFYGCNIEEFMDSVKTSLAYEIHGPSLIMASLLSDAQEMIERDMKEEARHNLNKVKYILANCDIRMK